MKNYKKVQIHCDKHKLVYLENFCCTIRDSTCSKEKNREGRRKNKEERKLDYFLAYFSNYVQSSIHIGVLTCVLQIIENKNK